MAVDVLVYCSAALVLDMWDRKVIIYHEKDFHYMRKKVQRPTMNPKD